MRNWEKAKQLLDEALKEIDSADDRANLGAEHAVAQRNEEIVTNVMRKAGVEAIKLPVSNEPPVALKDKDLQRYYPVGKHMRSVALLKVTGCATNKDWGLHAETNFVYLYQLQLDSQVLSNDGHKVKFELFCPEASQVAYYAKHSLELDLPGSPLVSALWTNVEDNWLRGIPSYSVAKSLLNLDRRLKKTLTTLQGWGLRLGDDADTAVTAEIENLAGVRLQLDYVDGLGVSSIHVLGGHKLDARTLQALADNTGALLDYFIFPDADKKVGESWKVRARDIAPILPIADQASLFGSITLKRQPDAAKDKQARLSVTKGEVTVVGRGDQQDERGLVRVKSGTVHYSLEGRFVESARCELAAQSFYRSKNHLLFRAECMSRY